jgi:crotonobetainyl-CoA:carnitine CoA-transferase CaiB-like acyl-CoA transferase
MTDGCSSSVCRPGGSCRRCVTGPPRAGQHTTEILTELGYNEAQINDVISRPGE